MNLIDIDFNCLDEFHQNIIKEFEIDYKSLDGITNLLLINELAVFMYYIADIQLVLYKHYLKNKLNVELSNEEIIDKIKNNRLKLFDRLKIIEIDDLSMVERADIYRNFNSLIEINKNIMKFGLNEDIIFQYANVKEFSIAYFTNLYQVTRNIKLKDYFMEMGLNEYINHINKLLEQENKKQAYIRQKRE